MENKEESKVKCLKCGASMKYEDDEYGSLGEGGSYEIWCCTNKDCNARRYLMLPD